jgi:AraC family transcriptional regulator
MNGPFAPLWSQAFRSQSCYDNFVEGHLSGHGYDVRLHRTHWPEPGSGVFNPSLGFIKMHLGPAAPVVGSYASHHPRPLRDVIFVPQGAQLHIRWEQGRDRGVSCMVDFAQLSEAAGFEWSWPEFDLASTLCVGNDYVRAGMRRIAEEVLAPGFASDIQIECALTFIALEIRRQLKGAPKRLDRSQGTLTHQQLSRLRSLVIESRGPPPGIAELSAASGMTSRQLALAHRKTVGVTLRSFIAQARLERAKILLVEGRTLIKQVSFECGFSGSAAFTAAFRKATGETPRSFRAKTKSL